MELIKPFIIDVFGCLMNIEYALLYFSCQVKILLEKEKGMNDTIGWVYTVLIS